MAFIVVLILLGLGLWLYSKFFKIPKIKNVVFVDGAPGAGKTFYSVYLACRLWRKAMRRYRVALVFSKFPILGSKIGKPERPLLISNIPLMRVPFQPLTLDIIERKKRVPFRSVILIDEASLLADQMDWKDKHVNDSIRDFAKLFRHFSHNGFLILNSQSSSDMHFGFKAVLSEYLYIHHPVNLPFFTFLKVQEMAYSADKDGGNVVNAIHQDIEDQLKNVLVPNRYRKKYDTLCYSILTDDLPFDTRTKYIEKGESLKCRDIVTFRKGRYMVQAEIKNVKEVN